MSADADRYATVAQGFTDRLAGLTDDQWSNPTPCPEWTVRDLVAHTIRTQRFVLASLGDIEAAEPDVDGDLRAQWSEATAALLDAVNDAEKAARSVQGVAGPIPFGSLVGGIGCSDTALHTWDLARATGQDESLDPEAVAHCDALLASFGDAIRRPGAFGDALPCPEDTDPQTKFLRLAGRSG
jgi:uncharacterized protein (TIGR03086 family)